MANINNILTLKKDVVFGGAVQTDWYYDKDKSKIISENFIFHGPNFFGVTQEDIEFKSHKLMDTCSYADMIANKLYEDEGSPIVLTIAGYGTGKSHLAITLGSLFSRTNDDLDAQNILKQIKSADIDIAKKIESKLIKPNLVIVLNGMKDFNLNYEILNTAKQVLKNYGYSEEIFSEYTKAYNIAGLFVERNFDKFEEEFIRFAKTKNIVSNNLKQYLIDNIYKDEVFDSINEVYNLMTGNYIRWDEGVSSADVLKNIVDKMCGDNAPFNKVLILFDEFGRYIEYASAYPNRAGDSALQQIFEAIQDSSNNIIFAGFIQSDLKTYLSRVNKTSNISRYIGRYESGEKVYLSSNLETIFAHLIKIKDEYLYNKFILEKLEKDKNKEDNNLLFNKISDWLPTSKNRGIWKDKNKFDDIILKGIYPFNPLTTWMLNYLSDWYQQRSAINFLINSFEYVENSEITELGILPQILPIDIIKSDFFNELLLAENEGRQKSENCVIYNSIYIKYNQKLSKIELDVLSGVLILKLGNFRTVDREDVLLALKYITGQANVLIEEAINQLQDNYGIIEYDEKNSTFDFVEDAIGMNDFKRFLRKKKLEIENQEIELLLTPKIKEELGLTNSYDNAFSKKYNIKTNEWVYKQDIVTSLRIDDVFLKNLKSDMELSTSPDKPKGRIIYIYNNSEVDNIQNIEKLYVQLKLHENPIIFILIDDKNKYLLDEIINITVITRFTEEEKAKFSRFINNFIAKTTQNLRHNFDSLAKERLIVSEKGVVKSEKKLKILCLEKFEYLYERIIPFAFDGFDKKTLTPAKKNHGNICRTILTSGLNYQWLQLQPRELQNRVSAVIQNNVTGWGALTENYEIKSPQNPKVKYIFNEIDEILDKKEEVSIYNLYLKYTRLPDGMNDYSFSMLISIYISLKKLETKIYQNNSAILTSEWTVNFFKEKNLDFKYLKSTKLKKVNLEGYILKYQKICTSIENNNYASECPNLKIELEELLKEEEPREDLKIRVESCRRMVNHGYVVNEKVVKDIANKEQVLEESQERVEFKRILPIIIECEEKTESIDGDEDFLYNPSQMKKFEILASRGRKFIENKYEYFLNHNAKCKQIGSVNAYDKWMRGLSKNLDKLGYRDLSRKTLTRLEKETENLNLIKERESMKIDIKKLTTSIHITEYTNQDLLLDWEKNLADYKNRIKENKLLSSQDKIELDTELDLYLDKVKKELNNIMDKITNIIDRSLELKSIKDANNLLSDIKLILNRNLKSIDRVDIEEIGEALQLIITDLDSIKKLDDYNDQKKEIAYLKKKYKNYQEDCILSSDSILNECINLIDLKIQDLNEKWTDKNLKFDEQVISKWSTEECFGWLEVNRALPTYLYDETINLYNEIKKLVELRVNELNIESIVTIFNSLDSDKKIECIKILEELATKVTL